MGRVRPTITTSSAARIGGKGGIESNASRERLLLEVTLEVTRSSMGVNLVEKAISRSLVNLME